MDYAERYLGPKGWFESVRTRESVDGSGPCPWITYPALKVLGRIIRPNYRVLECGSGSSSLWWRARVRELVTVAHAPDRISLYEAMAPLPPHDVLYILQ